MSKEKLGMYAVNDPTHPQVKIGDFTICRQDKDGVWIQNDDGEGAEFPDALFGACVKDFFEKNF
jgi:hypothetical protein